MPVRPLALAAALLALLAGCATVPPAQRAAACAATDWHRYGVNDGKLGVPVAERTDLLADCRALGHPPDFAVYNAGRAEGLKEYCTVENGYEVGYRGQRYRQVCPPALEPDFLQGYAQGRSDRPAYAVYPRVGIGIGSGHVHSGVGLGVGVGGWGYDPYWDRCWNSPFPTRWCRDRRWGYPGWW